jgi:uncharacterized membrane protein YphA (DoxX/SURF4 family)
MMKKTLIVDIICILFMILFLYTGLSKLMEYSVFKEQISESPILAPVSSVIAIGLPLIEIITTVALLIPQSRLFGLYVSLGLMTIFTVYIILLLSFSHNLPCSCGGVLEELSWSQHIILNTAFIALGITGLILERRSKQNNNNNVKMANL